MNRSLEAFSENGRLSVILWDFNYRFCAVKVDNPPEQMTIWLSQKPVCYLDLEPDRPLQQGGNRELNIYRVVNYQDFIADVALVDLLQAQPADAVSARGTRTAAGLARRKLPRSLANDR